MYVPVTMERREEINKFKKIPKVAAEPRCHLRFRINLRFNISFKKRWNQSKTSLRHSRKEKAFPSFTMEKGISSNTDEHTLKTRLLIPPHRPPPPHQRQVIPE